jgi:NADPH2:quinone reductase
VKAIVIREFGVPDAFAWEETPAPKPGPGELLIRVGTVALSWSDLLQAEGTYHAGGPQPPFTPGWELVGEVVGHGAGVTSPQLGTRVTGFLGAPSALADYVVAPTAVMDEAPDWLSDVQAAAYVVPFLTADAALSTVGRLRDGEAVLIHAAAGGVGAAAVQLCRAAGASPIIATAGNETRRAAARQLGADVVAGYADFDAHVRDATGGRGVDLVLESVGGDVFDRSLMSLAPLGRLVSIGASAGERPGKLKLPVLWHGAVSVAGVHIARWLNDRPDLLAPSRERVRALLASGAITPVVGATFPAARTADAYRALRSREVVGRVIVDLSAQD